jgi:hypothetical protein
MAQDPPTGPEIGGLLVTYQPVVFHVQAGVSKAWAKDSALTKLGGRKREQSIANIPRPGKGRARSVMNWEIVNGRLRL